MQFPRTEAEIEVFARWVIQGLLDEAANLPAPPMPLEVLQAKLDAYKASADVIVLAEKSLSDQHAFKDTALGELIDGLKQNIRYAEAVFRNQPAKLKALAWGPRSEGTQLEIPGEVRGIEMAKQGDNWVELRWKAPGEGGVPAFYQVQRKQGDRPWEDVGTATRTAIRLADQPRGVELTYWVFAVNRAGIGGPSSIVTAVL